MLENMVDSRWDRFDQTARELDRFARFAQRQAAEAHGSDPSAAVTVGLDPRGRVDAMTVAADWRRRVRGSLPDAVRAAVQAVTTARLEAWANAMNDPSADVAPATEADLQAPRDFAVRLQEAVTAHPTPEAGEAALGALLGILQQVERGLDQASAQVERALSRAVQGRSSDGKVAVTLSGGGDLREVRYDRPWLQHAAGSSISRQTLAALRDAYSQLDQDGVAKLIADSPLGEAQRAVQDPFGLASRMRLTD
jgi:DNA-binding protein YbaB